jgi:branched-chain amino acid transport system ATP-binding protein
LLGANNSGKSTLINCISGLLRPLAGRISFEGADITRLKPHERVAGGIVQVPEGRQVFPKMSVLENLLLGGTLGAARAQRGPRLDQVFALFPRLAERRPQAAGTLSGGEQQMLAIGRALMSGPRLLMLDEPSLGLSPLFVQIIFKALGELNKQGLTILLIEQNLTLTLAYAARGVVLERGHIALEGTREMLSDDPRTRAAYLGL